MGDAAPLPAIELRGLVKDFAVGLRGLKLRVPVKGVRAKLIPTDLELEACRTLGCELALHLTGQVDNRIIDMAALA